MIKHYCIDCHKKLSRSSCYKNIKRCRSCSCKERFKDSKNHPQYIDGRSILQHYCIDCNKKICKKAKRCLSCADKYKHKIGSLNVKGRNNNHFGKPIRPNWKKYKNIWFRSNWEVQYAKYLDKNKISWLYESKTFDLGNTTYTPDFYLPKTNEYIEIKGYKTDIFKNKIRKFKNQYRDINIKILNQKELKQLGVI